MARSTWRGLGRIIVYTIFKICEADLLEWYLPEYNKRFCVLPANDTDVHVRLPKDFGLDSFLCIKTERTIRKDNTVSHNGKLYQIEDVTKYKKVTCQK